MNRVSFNLPKDWIVKSDVVGNEYIDLLEHTIIPANNSDYERIVVTESNYVMCDFQDEVDSYAESLLSRLPLFYTSFIDGYKILYECRVADRKALFFVRQECESSSAEVRFSVKNDNPFIGDIRISVFVKYCDESFQSQLDPIVEMLSSLLSFKL